MKEEKEYKTINDFIVELQRISEEKRNMPLVIDCPNGTETYPNIKMRWSDPLNIMTLPPDKMVITWQ